MKVLAWSWASIILWRQQRYLKAYQSHHVRRIQTYKLSIWRSLMVRYYLARNAQVICTRDWQLSRKIPWRLSKHQKARQRQRLRAVDAVVATVDKALTKQGVTTKSVERWKAEMPTEQEMLPKDKYSLFDRKEKKYRKGIHSEFFNGLNCYRINANGLLQSFQNGPDSRRDSTHPDTRCAGYFEETDELYDIHRCTSMHGWRSRMGFDIANSQMAFFVPYMMSINQGIFWNAVQHSRKTPVNSLK